MYLSNISNTLKEIKAIKLNYFQIPILTWGGVLHMYNIMMEFQNRPTISVRGIRSEVKDELIVYRPRISTGPGLEMLDITFTRSFGALNLVSMMREPCPSLILNKCFLGRYGSPWPVTADVSARCCGFSPCRILVG